MRAYTISKDTKSGQWYAHLKGYSYISIMGSIGTKWEAQQYANMYNLLPHKVGEIEERRRQQFAKGIGV